MAQCIKVCSWQRAGGTTKKGNNYSNEFNVAVVLDSIKRQEAVIELTSEYGMDMSQLGL